MIDLFLKKNEHNQITLLGTVLSKNQKQIFELKKEFNVTKSSFNRYITNLNKDLATLYDDKLALIYDGINIQLSNPDNLEAHNIFMSVLKYYTNKSTCFKILILLSKNEALDCELILKELHISYSYLNRLIKEINDYLVNSAITLSQKNRMLSITGPIKNVIFFKSFLRLSLWRFEDSYAVSNEETEEFLFFNSNESTALNHLQVIRLNYIEQAFLEVKQKDDKVTIYDKEVIELCRIVSTHHNLITLEKSNVYDDEQLFLNFIARIFCPQLDTLEDRVILAQHFLEQNSSITQDVLILLNSLENKLNLNLSQNKNDYYHFIYQGVMSFIYLRLFNYDFSSLFTLKIDFIKELYTRNQPYYLKIKESIKSPLPFTNDKNTLLLLRYPEPFYNFIYTAFRNKNKTVIQIFLDLKYQLGFELFLKQRLDTIFSHETINYQNDINLADIIITDSFIETREDQAAFILVEPNSIKEMESLIIKISKIYTHKLLNNSDSY